MNKYIIILMLCIGIIANSINAQDFDNRAKLQFGLKIGTNYSNVYDSQGEEFNADPKFGLVLGAFAAIPIGESLGIQPEMMFSQKGFQGKGKILGSPYSFNRTTNYIDVPIMLAIKPSELITILIGPQYSYLVEQTDVFENAITTVEQQQKFENEDIRDNLLSIIGGVNINLMNLVIGGRVAWDFMNNSSDGNSTTPRYKNTWLQLSIGYRFFDH